MHKDIGTKVLSTAFGETTKMLISRGKVRQIMSYPYVKYRAPVKKNEGDLYVLIFRIR